jgi:hypothetical protein
LRFSNALKACAIIRGVHLLGHLDIADLNHDGWLDSGDIAHYMQFGAPPNRQAPHTGTEDFIQTQE